MTTFCLVAKLCQTLCDPGDCSLPGFSIHWVSQARILEYGIINIVAPESHSASYLAVAGSSSWSSRSPSWVASSCLLGSRQTPSLPEGLCHPQPYSALTVAHVPWLSRHTCFFYRGMSSRDVIFLPLTKECDLLKGETHALLVDKFSLLSILSKLLIVSYLTLKMILKRRNPLPHKEPEAQRELVPCTISNSNKW